MPNIDWISFTVIHISYVLHIFYLYIPGREWVLFWKDLWYSSAIYSSATALDLSACRSSPLVHLLLGMVLNHVLNMVLLQSSSLLAYCVAIPSKVLSSRPSWIPKACHLTVLTRSWSSLRSGRLSMFEKEEWGWSDGWNADPCTFQLITRQFRSRSQIVTPPLAWAHMAMKYYARRVGWHSYFLILCPWNWLSFWVYWWIYEHVEFFESLVSRFFPVCENSMIRSIYRYKHNILYIQYNYKNIYIILYMYII